MAEFCADLHRSRRRNLALPIETLQRIGGLRAGLDVETATDILWSVASPELWMLRIEQGGATPESNKAWLRATLRRNYREILPLGIGPDIGLSKYLRENGGEKYEISLDRALVTLTFCGQRFCPAQAGTTTTKLCRSESSSENRGL
jgi:hypothetical protein